MRRRCRLLRKNKPKFRVVPGSDGRLFSLVVTQRSGLMRPVETFVIYTNAALLRTMATYGGYYGGGTQNYLKWSIAFRILTGPRAGDTHIKDERKWPKELIYVARADAAFTRCRYV